MFKQLLDWLFGRIEPLNIPEKANQISELNLENGTSFTITNEDLSESSADKNWDLLARKFGTYKSKLQNFNQTIKTFTFLGFELYQYSESMELQNNTTIYIPSNDELLLFEFKIQFENRNIAITNLQDFINSDQYKIFKTARKRASKKIGESYGTESLVFLSPNKSLDGASENRTEIINNEKQYQVNWGPNVWKCNIYMHDCIYDSGFKVHLLSNNHYITAGMLHNSSKYEKVKIAAVKPGIIMQLYSGNESNESHNLILASFIERINYGTEIEEWKFYAYGAEQKESAVSFRIHMVNSNDNIIEDFYEVTEGKRTHIRFFKPIFAR